MKLLHPWISSACFGLLLVACRDPVEAAYLNEAREVGVNVEMPFDATPSPQADAVYFTAMTLETGGALFKVGTQAAGAPTMLASGFVAPMSLVVSSDGATIFVADLGLMDEDLKENVTRPVGVVYAVPSGGGEPAKLPATEGFGPRSLDLVVQAEGDVLYFTGSNPETGAAGVYRLPIASGAREAVYEGPQLGEPSGVAVTESGEIFVVDTVSQSGSSVVQVAPGSATEFVGGLRVGYPAGIALSIDDATLLVSGLSGNGEAARADGQKDAVAGALVYRIDVDSASVIETISGGISQNTESAGLHRAHDVDNFAWADANSPGTVYLLGTTNRPLPK